MRKKNDIRLYALTGLLVAGLALPVTTMGQKKDPLTISGNVVSIRHPISYGRLKEILHRGKIHFRVGHFNMAPDSCNRGFRVFLSTDRGHPSLAPEGPAYLGSFFMDHDCSTIFVIDIKKNLSVISRSNRSINTLYFTFQFIDRLGKPVYNNNYLKGLRAGLTIE